ncbi:MAG: glycosyltransferase family 4 protein [Nitrospira sp.]|nr:glycosyltransferase family 4 protein [Nitrospira sp.]
MKRWRLAYLVTHPIQYQAPLLRMIAGQPDISLATFFCTDFSLKAYIDAGFGKSIAWDVPLTDGYAHEFLPVWGTKDSLSFIRPWIYGLKKRLVDGNFDVLWVHGWGQLSHIIAVLAAHRLGIKVLLRGEAGLHLPRHGFFKQWLKDQFLYWLFKRVDGFLAIGRLNRDFYLRYDVLPERVFMMPYAVDNAFFQEQAHRAEAGRAALRSELRLKPGRPIFLFASKMIDRKRAEDLLDAFISLFQGEQEEPNAYLLFVGDGARRVALEQRAARLGWDAIRFLGFKNQTELSAYYDLCDAFVLPSVEEPWGLVVNEVMNAGRAVIVSDEVGCHLDLVKDGVNGYVFRAGDVVSLRTALSKVVHDLPRCRMMGRESREIINAFSFQEDIAGLRQAINSVMGTP